MSSCFSSLRVLGPKFFLGEKNIDHMSHFFFSFSAAHIYWFALPHVQSFYYFRTPTNAPGGLTRLPSNIAALQYLSLNSAHILFYNKFATCDAIRFSTYSCSYLLQKTT